MADLREIVLHLDRELRSSEIKDYPGAHNGLQLENQGRVDRVVSAVDASLAIVEEAARVPNTLLIVHHGMFWQGVRMIEGSFYKKLKIAMEANLAIYSSHLPLDIHPEMGNNVLLAKELGLTDIKPAFYDKGLPVGVAGSWTGSRDEFCRIVREVVGREIVVCGAGKEELATVAVATGGAGSMVTEIHSSGVDLFVTGEGSHWTFVESEELGFNTVYAGHYATEVFGVKKLAQIVGEVFSMESIFIKSSGGL